VCGCQTLILSREALQTAVDVPLFRTVQQASEPASCLAVSTNPRAPPVHINAKESLHAEPRRLAGIKKFRDRTELQNTSAVRGSLLNHQQHEAVTLYRRHIGLSLCPSRSLE
jgi:hypothetical protein